MSEQNQAVVRMYQSGDGPSINDCFNRVFNKSRPYQVWKWRYEDNPSRDRPLPTSIAVDGDKVVGQYGVAPTFIRINAERKVACQALDNFIEEEYRKSRGLQKEMFRASHESAADNQFDIGYGYPNKLAYKVGKKLLGYQDVTKMSPYFIRLNLLQACYNRNIPGTQFLAPLISSIGSAFYRSKIQSHFAPSSEDIKIQAVDHFSPDVDALSQRHYQRYKIAVERSQKYLNWRYAERPAFHYHILEARQNGSLVGYITFRMDDREPRKRVGYICDFIFEQDEVFFAMLHKALLQLIDLKTDYAQIISSDHQRIEPLFRKAGFTTEDFLAEIPLVYNTFSYQDDSVLSNPENWYITYGDTEIT